MPDTIQEGITAEQAKELLAAATPGPWKRYGMAGVSAPDWEIVYEGPVECAECEWRIALTGCVTNDDALLVAAAPDLAQAVIDLTERAEKAEAKIAAVRDAALKGGQSSAVNLRAAIVALGGEQS